MTLTPTLKQRWQCNPAALDRRAAYAVIYLHERHSTRSWGKIMRVAVTIAMACGLLAVAGCATIVKGTTQAIAINTPGAAGAQCTLNSTAIGGPKVITTPATITLEKSQESITVLCKKECFQDGSGIIASNTETMAAGNILMGGPIGLGIDAASGAMNKYNADNQIAMVAIPNCKPKA